MSKEQATGRHFNKRGGVVRLRPRDWTIAKPLHMCRRRGVSTLGLASENPGLGHLGGILPTSGTPFHSCSEFVSCNYLAQPGSIAGKNSLKLPDSQKARFLLGGNGTIDMAAGICSAYFSPDSRLQSPPILPLYTTALSQAGLPHSRHNSRL